MQLSQIVLEPMHATVILTLTSTCQPKHAYSMADGSSRCVIWMPCWGANTNIYFPVEAVTPANATHQGACWDVASGCLLEFGVAVMYGKTTHQQHQLV